MLFAPDCLTQRQERVQCGQVFEYGWRALRVEWRGWPMTRLAGLLYVNVKRDH